MSEALQFTIIDATSGAILRHGTAPDDQFQHQCQPGEKIVLGLYPGDQWYWDGRDMQPIPTKPADDEHVRWDRAQRTWIDPRTPEMVDHLKLAQWRAARRTAYPDIGDQLEVIWQELQHGGPKTQEAKDMLQRINAAKASLPKP